MQKNLTALQPVLKETQKEVDEMMVQISADKEAAGKTRVTVEAQAEAAALKERNVKLWLKMRNGTWTRRCQH